MLNKIKDFGWKKTGIFAAGVAFAAKGVRKCSITKQKSICEANLGWIFAHYRNAVSSNMQYLEQRKEINIVDSENAMW